MTQNIQEARKAIIALVGFLGILVANNAVHGTALRWTNAVIAIATAVLTYAIPNAASTDPTTSTPDI